MEASQTTAQMEEPAVKQIMAQMEAFRRGQSEQLLMVIEEVRWANYMNITSYCLLFSQPYHSSRLYVFYSSLSLG
jgi:hypothetical protein